MLPPAEASLLRFLEAISTAPAVAQRSPDSNHKEPGLPSAEVPVLREMLPPPWPPAEYLVRINTLPLSENLEGEVSMRTELSSPLSALVIV